jgi:hypothetical protein
VSQSEAVGFQEDFSYAYFRRLVAGMKDRYVPCRFGEAQGRLQRPERPIIFLRHDVDVCLERALDMARLEQEMEMPATYMVLAKAVLYDYRSAASARSIRDLRRCGHEVGLHFDIEAEGVAADADRGEVERVVAAARDALTDVLGEPVRSFSFHRPIPRFLRGPLKVAGMVNAYAAELMADYISDSKANWREGDPLARILRPSRGVLQVVIHPIWWGPAHQTGPERLQSFFESRTAGQAPESSAAYSDALARAVQAVRRASSPR